MAVAQLGDECFECVEHVEISAGVEVGRRQRRGGVQHRHMADAGLGPELLLDVVGDVDDLALLAGLNRELFQTVTNEPEAGRSPVFGKIREPGRQLSPETDN